MTQINIEKNRTKLLTRLISIAKKINVAILNSKYSVEVYFSGRDDDFVILEFKSQHEAIEMNLEFKDHKYQLYGDEVIHLKRFDLLDGQYLGVTNEKLTLKTIHKSIDSEMKVILNNFLNDLFSIDRSDSK